MLKVGLEGCVGLVVPMVEVWDWIAVFGKMC